MKLYIEKRKKNDYMYAVLVYDVGYKKIALSVDKLTICEVAGITPAQLENIKLGEKYAVKI